MLLAGLDPGGIDGYGWCLAESVHPELISIKGPGTTDNAGQAVDNWLHRTRSSHAVIECAHHLDACAPPSASASALAWLFL